MELQIFGALGTIEEGHHRFLNLGVGFENVKGVDNKSAQLGRFHLTKKEAGTDAEKESGLVTTVENRRFDQCVLDWTNQCKSRLP